MCQSSFVTPELLNNKGGGIVMMEYPVFKLIYCFVLSQANFRLAERMKSINVRSNDLQYLERTDVNKKRDSLHGVLKIYKSSNKFILRTKYHSFKR